MSEPQPLTTLLYVDDDHILLPIACMALTTIGKFTVNTCSTGADALEAIASGFLPDMILLDVNMPNLNGPATLGKLRHFSQTVETPVVFMTAETDIEKLNNLKSMGILGIIAKPFNPTKLSHHIMNLWNQQRSMPTKNHTHLISIELHAEYLAQLHEQHVVLERLRDVLTKESFSSTGYQELKFLAHKMAGSGTLFGYPNVSQAAKAVEIAKNSDTTISALITLINLCTKILNTHSQ